ncbi:oligosaccharide flippase family protein [Pontiella desulfatans]|nr:oligosaccharide flippase family protein [Pontiella desulfatans]
MGWLLGEKLGTVAIAFLVSLVVARYLGPEKYGLMCYALAFVAMFEMIGTLGSQEILVRELLAAEGEEGRILCTAFILRCCGVVVASVVALLSVYLSRPDDAVSVILVLIACGMYVGQLFLMVQQWFASQLLAKYVTIATLVGLCIASVAKLLMVRYQQDVVYFVVASVAQVVLAGGILFFLYFRKNRQLRHRWTWSGRWARKLLGDCWPRIISGMSTSAINNLSTIFVGNLLASQILGEFSVAKRLLFFLLFAPGIITQSLAPSLVKAKESGDAGEYERQLVRLYRYLMLLGLGLGLLLALVGWLVVPVLYGHEYPKAGFYLMGMAATFPFYSVGQGRVWFIITQRAYQYNMWVGVASALMSLGLTYLGIQLFGVWGAIGAQVVTVVWIVLFQDLAFSRYRINSLSAWRALSPVWIFGVMRDSVKP